MIQKKMNSDVENLNKKLGKSSKKRNIFASFFRNCLEPVEHKTLENLSGFQKKIEEKSNKTVDFLIYFVFYDVFFEFLTCFVRYLS